MRSNEKELYSELKNVFMFAIEHLEEIKKEMASDTDNAKENSDTSFCLKKCVDLMEILRKEFNKVKSTADAHVCWQCLQDSRTTVRTEYTTATVKSGIHYPIPKMSSDPEAYLKLCEFFGLPKDIAEAEVFRIHWPGFTEYVNGMNEERKQLPPGIEHRQGSASFSLRHLTKKEPNE